MNVLSLFSGYGGLEMGVKEVFPDAEVVCHVEIEPYAQRILAKRYSGIPIWPDVTTLRGGIFFDAGIEIDAITGGFPCQSFSTAGKRGGVDDERGILFWQVARLAREIGESQGRLPMLFLENVPGLLSVDDGSTFGDILGTLAEMGFSVRWGVVGACHAGAPHRRERVFIMADSPE